MTHFQQGIDQQLPPHALYLFFSMRTEPELKQTLNALKNEVDGATIVAGLGQSLLLYLGKKIDGMRQFPQSCGAGFDIPSTPASLFCWLRGDDPGDLAHQRRHLVRLLKPSFTLDKTIDAFKYESGLDLTGYEDGTENPVGDEAKEVAFLKNSGPGLDGSSFVAIQQWVHDMEQFETFDQLTRDHMIGRRQSDNEELDEAPESAHVKRTAQESFSPEAFLLRRSMPWTRDLHMGLVFVAFATSFDPFEAQLNRMTGAEDGIADALFRFTRPVSGAYYWCPPVIDGGLDLSMLGV